jgi:hypothetical protein
MEISIQKFRLYSAGVLLLVFNLSADVFWLLYQVLCSERQACQNYACLLEFDDTFSILLSLETIFC